MCHMWTSHVTRMKVTSMNTSSHNHEHVVAHTWMRHVLRIKSHTQVWMSHVSSCPAEWHVSCMWMCHVTYDDDCVYSYKPHFSTHDERPMQLQSFRIRILGTRLVRGHVYISTRRYGVATMSRFLKIIGLFGKKVLSKRLYSAEEILDFEELTNRSHPIRGLLVFDLLGVMYIWQIPQKMLHSEIHRIEKLRFLGILQ